MGPTDRRSVWGDTLRRFPASRYTVAIVATALAVALRMVLNPVLGDGRVIYTTLFATLLVVGWYAGLGPALVSLALGAVAAIFFILPPEFSWAVATPFNIAGLFVYLIFGAACAAFGHTMQQARRQAEANAQLARDRQQQLEEEAAERRCILESLRESNERLQQVLDELQATYDQSPIGMLQLDTNLRYVRVNQTMAAMNGIPEAEHKGKTVYEVVPDLAANIERAFRKVIKTGKPVLNVEISGETIADPGVRRTWIESWFPLRDTSGKVIGLNVVAQDITARKRAEEELLRLNETLEERVVERTAALAQSEEQLRRVASVLTMAEQEERRRISQVLHDDLQQQLYAIQLKLDSARRDAEAGDMAMGLAGVAEAEQWLIEGIETTRRLTVDLSPPILKSEGLAHMLGWLVSQMKEMHDLDVALVADRPYRIQDEDMRVFLFQIVRELLFNVVKHAGAKHATITLREADARLVISVADDGRGFDVSQAARAAEEGGFGLFSVRERLGLFGGRMAIESAPGEGARVTVRVPMRLDEPLEATGAATKRVPVSKHEPLL